MINPYSNSSLKRYLRFIAVYSFLITCFCFNAFSQVHDYLHVPVRHPSFSLFPGEKKITITGVGDIMFGTAYPSKRLLPQHDNPLILLGTLADTLAASDITFGNLEGSFLNEGEPSKRCRDTTICYVFRMPERYAGALSVAGFDIMSIANNHFGDFGYPARKRTMQLLDSLGIEYAGLIEKPYSIFTRGPFVYGFCAFAPNAGTVSIVNIPEAESIVKFLADTCDIVIVSFHGGAEGAEYQNVTRKEELSFGESRGNVYNFSHRMIDAGADVVFGHGPHVTRAIEVYKNRFIAYSLGNFCTYGKFNLSGPNGIAPVIKLNVDTRGKFLSGTIIPVYQIYYGGVKVDPDKRVIRKIRELTEQDFPESVIDLSENGEITYK